MKHYYRMRVAKPGHDSIYFAESTSDMLDLSRQSYPRVPEGDVMLFEITKEAYYQLREASMQVLARLEMNQRRQDYKEILEFVGKS